MIIMLSAPLVQLNISAEAGKCHTVVNKLNAVFYLLTYQWYLTDDILPMIYSLIQINLVFLLNIVRILVSKLQANSTPEVDQVRWAASYFSSVPAPLPASRLNSNAVFGLVLWSMWLLCKKRAAEEVRACPDLAGKLPGLQAHLEWQL